MFKKITALLLLTVFTNVYAFSPIDQSTAIRAELSKTFNSLNYTLNVEWDQKDAKYFDDSVANFEEKITALQNNGLTNEELMNYALENIKDKEIKNDINELAKVINDSQMTNEEARAFTIAKLNSTYSHGASWSGSRMGCRTAFIVGAIIVVVALVHYNRCHTSTGTCDFLPGL